jgi:hypothetical protein
MGGMTIMAAADRPVLRERAAAVLLCSTGAANLSAESRVIPMRTPQGRRRAHRLMLHSRAPLGPVSAVTRAALKYATMGAGSSPEQVEACARIVHACPTGVRAHWGRVLYGLELTGGAARLDVPTEVVVGTADRLTPVVHAHRLASVLPDCRLLTELPGLGHMAPLENPGAVVTRLRALVAEHLAVEHLVAESGGSFREPAGGMAGEAGGSFRNPAGEKAGETEGSFRNPAGEKAAVPGGSFRNPAGKKAAEPDGSIRKPAGEIADDTNADTDSETGTETGTGTAPRRKGGKTKGEAA